MYKIKYLLLILVFAYNAVLAENLSIYKKNIKDILLVTDFRKKILSKHN